MTDDREQPTSAGQPWAKAGSAPVPDPTKLTTDAVSAATAVIMQLYDSKLEGLIDLIEEKFVSVEDKLALGEKLRVEQKADTEKAIQAALLAQKEAVAAQAAAFAESVDKSEKATAKQLDGLASAAAAQIGGVTNSLGELKDRVTTIESRDNGRLEQRTDSRLTIGTVLGVVAGVVGVVGLIITILVISLPGT
jgi:hypothetical protein